MISVLCGLPPAQPYSGARCRKADRSQDSAGVCPTQARPQGHLSVICLPPVSVPLCMYSNAQALTTLSCSCDNWVASKAHPVASCSPGSYNLCQHPESGYRSGVSHQSGASGRPGRWSRCSWSAAAPAGRFQTPRRRAGPGT